MMKKIISLLAVGLLAAPIPTFAQTNPQLDQIFANLNTVVTNISAPSLPQDTSLTNPQIQRVVLGNERITSDYASLIDGKRVGLVTNQTGINADGVKTVDLLYNYPKASLTSIYSPEHGLDGTAKAGEYVDSYTDTRLNLPVYSLYGKTREPSKAMLENVDILLFDMQDIGSRTYTYISTLNYVMKAAAKYDKTVIVLDRPNPLGGTIVDGYIAKDKYLTFVGVDNLPIQHGMTVGELAQFFNRKINCKLEIVPMQNYNRDMVWQDTGLSFVATSPNIPNIQSAFGYIATGMGEGTTVGQSDKFTWIGSTGLSSEVYAQKLNAAGLSGVEFVAETKSSRGGARLVITNYKTFNPTKTCIYALTIANQLKTVTVPVETNGTIPMFEKIWGGTEFGLALKNKWTAEQVIASYQTELNSFKAIRKNYLIY